MKKPNAKGEKEKSTSILPPNLQTFNQKFLSG